MEAPGPKGHPGDPGTLVGTPREEGAGWREPPDQRAQQRGPSASGTQPCCRVLQPPLVNVQRRFKPLCLVLPISCSWGPSPSLVTQEVLPASFRRQRRPSDARPHPQPSWPLSPSPPDSGRSEPPALLSCSIPGGHADPSSCSDPVCGVSLASTRGSRPPLSAARHLTCTAHIQGISLPQPLPTCPPRSQDQPTSACIPGPWACPQRLRDSFLRKGKALGSGAFPPAQRGAFPPVGAAADIRKPGVPSSGPQEEVGSLSPGRALKQSCSAGEAAYPRLHRNLS